MLGKALPSIRALKNKKFEWSKDCQKAFKDIKRFLSSLPLLRRPIPGEVLYSYLSGRYESITSILVREEQGHQSPTYYMVKS